MCKTSCCSTKICQRGPRGFPGRDGDQGPQGIPGVNEIDINKSIFVDQQYGDIITAERENMGAPYPTIQSALLVALPGDTIYVQPGTYNGPFTLVDGVNIYFSLGVTVVGSGPHTFISPGAYTCRLEGYGKFLINGTLLRLPVDGANIVFEADEVSYDVYILNGGNIDAILNIRSIIGTLNAPFAAAISVNPAAVVFLNFVNAVIAGTLLRVSGPGTPRNTLYIEGEYLEIGGRLAFVQTTEAAVNIVKITEIRSTYTDVPVDITQISGSFTLSSSIMSTVSGVVVCRGTSGQVHPTAFINIDKLDIVQAISTVTMFEALNSTILVNSGDSINIVGSSIPTVVQVSGPSYVSMDTPSIVVSGVARMVNISGNVGDLGTFFGNFGSAHFSCSVINQLRGISYFTCGTVIVDSHGTTSFNSTDSFMYFVADTYEDGDAVATPIMSSGSNSYVYFDCGDIYYSSPGSVSTVNLFVVKNRGELYINTGSLTVDSSNVTVIDAESPAYLYAERIEINDAGVGSTAFNVASLIVDEVVSLNASIINTTGTVIILTNSADLGSVVCNFGDVTGVGLCAEITGDCDTNFNFDKMYYAGTGITSRMFNLYGDGRTYINGSYINTTSTYLYVFFSSIATASHVTFIDVQEIRVAEMGIVVFNNCPGTVNVNVGSIVAPATSSVGVVDFLSGTMNFSAKNVVADASDSNVFFVGSDCTADIYVGNCVGNASPILRAGTNTVGAKKVTFTADTISTTSPTEGIIFMYYDDDSEYTVSAGVMKNLSNVVGANGINFDSITGLASTLAILRVPSSIIVLGTANATYSINAISTGLQNVVLGYITTNKATNNINGVPNAVVPNILVR